MIDPVVYTSAWLQEGKTVQFFVNYTEDEQDVTVSVTRGILRMRADEEKAVAGEITFRLAPRSSAALEILH